MAYNNPRGLPIADMGPTITTLCACTLADYSSSGTTTPVVGDAVTLSSTGSFYVKRCGDDTFARMGRVTKIEVAPTGTLVGYIGVEWFDMIRLISFSCSILANATLGNVVSKAGADSVASDFDAAEAQGSNGGNFICWAKSAATGVGTILGALFPKDS